VIMCNLSKVERASAFSLQFVRGNLGPNGWIAEGGSSPLAFGLDPEVQVCEW